MTPVFRHPVVRDLAWLFRCPPLLSPAAFPDALARLDDAAVFGAAAARDVAACLSRWDAQLDPEIAALTQQNGPRRLGRYAEALLSLWLHALPGAHVKALSLAVRDATGRTLGECDALFQTAQGAREHWELAVKFYLYAPGSMAPQHSAVAATAASSEVAATPGTSATAAVSAAATAAPATSSRVPHVPPDARADAIAHCAAYVGAGLADRFDWKLRRLLEHQLPLSAHPALLAMAPGPWQARMFVKGRFFYPLEEWQQPLPASCAAVINADHARGWWATLDTWKSWCRTAGCRWSVLARLDWLAPLCIDTRRAFDAAAMLAELNRRFDSNDPAHRLPVQIAALRQPSGRAHAPGGASARAQTCFDYAAVADDINATRPDPDRPDLLHEISRGFVVPNDWPERARRFGNATKN